MYRSMFSKVFGFIRTCDVAIEVVDARNIEGTRTSKFDVGLKDKLLIVATKVDMLPPETKRLKETQGIKIVYFSSRTREGLDKIFNTIRRFKKRGNRRIAVTIFGIPNVGKSTLINMLRGKHVAQTGFKPGITTGEQWINIGEDIRLMDTPGVFLKGESEPELAARGAMEAEKLKNPELAARHLVEKFIFHNNDNFFKYYKIEKCSADDALEAVAKKRGLLLKGGELNIFEAAKIIIREFQKGKFVL